MLDRFKSPKGRKQLLVIGLGLAGLILVIWYVKSHQNSTTSTGNQPTAAENASSWNDSSIWSSASGQHNNRGWNPSGTFGGGTGAGGTSGTLGTGYNPLQPSSGGMGGGNDGSMGAVAGPTVRPVSKTSFSRPHGIYGQPAKK